MKTYLRHRIVNVVDIKELIALEYLDLSGKYRDYCESHDFWELCFIESGSLRLISDGKERLLEKGQMSLVAPGSQHSYREDCGECLAYVICFESQSQSLRAVAGTVVTPDKSLQNCINIIISEATGTFETDADDRLQVISNPNFGGQQAIMAQLEYLLICTLRQVSSHENANVVLLGGNDFYADLTNILMEYFRQNVKGRLSLDSICKKINYSRSFLCKTFKEQTGQTIIACFNEMKLELACELLCTTDMTIAAIAQELSFSDSKYFNTFFKKHTGITPAVYRKKHQKGE